jgi:hypothetical protein
MGARAEIDNEVFDSEGNQGWGVVIVDGYEIKDILKENGYSFNGKKKVWYKNFQGQARDDDWAVAREEYKFLDPIIGSGVMGRGLFMSIVSHHLK